MWQTSFQLQAIKKTTCNKACILKSWFFTIKQTENEMFQEDNLVWQIQIVCLPSLSRRRRPLRRRRCRRRPRRACGWWRRGLEGSPTRPTSGRRRGWAVPRPSFVPPFASSSARTLNSKWLLGSLWDTLWEYCLYQVFHLFWLHLGQRNEMIIFRHFQASIEWATF